MTHIAIQERQDGNVVDWMEQVSDEQYNGWSTGQTKASVREESTDTDKTGLRMGGGLRNS